MKILKLTKEEKDICKNITLLNSKRNYLQHLSFDSLVKNTKTKKIVLSAFPRFGKSRSCLLLIQELNKYFTGEHLILVPTLHIKGEFIKLFKACNITNVIVSTTSGVFSKKFNRETEFLSITYDEGDFGISSNKSVKWTETLNLKSRWKLCMSGSYGYDNIKFLESKGFDCMYELNIDDGVLIGTLPSFDVYNLGVELTEKEKKQYGVLHEKVEFLLTPYRQLFPIGETCLHAISSITYGKQLINISGDIRTGDEWMKVLMNYTGWEGYVLLNRKRNYNLYQIKMNEILETAQNKLLIVDSIVRHYNKQGIIFTTRKETCDLLEKMNHNIIAYHSDSNIEALEMFQKKEKKAIVSVNKISRGFTESGIDYAINSNYNSASNGYIQKICRALSMDEETIDKNPFIINLYCKAFTNNISTIQPKDLIRLKKAQENTSVEWIDNIDQITND